MTRKLKIIDELGEKALMLPALVNRGLAANDRAKYGLTLIQAAKAHADRPEVPAQNLREERLAAGLDETGFDDLPAASSRSNDIYRIPRAAEVHAMIVGATGEMIEPLRAASGISLDGAASAEEYDRRLSALATQAPALADGTIPGAYIASMTSADRTSDSLHILIMDLHKTLNGLQARIAEDTIDGACVYQIEPGDRPRIAAFMRGLNRTAPLKFNHPGLDTTATRIGGRLVIQNDIGTTDAHVLIVNVADMTVRVTYTDIHFERLDFFRSLFEPFGVAWQDAQPQRTEGLGDEAYFLTTGRFTAADEEQLLRYLDFLGSRVVFLIDWNKARKRLQQFVKKKEAVPLLKWAADENLGHRAFLELGGERLIFEAIDYAARGRLRYGQSLQEVLGLAQTTGYLKFVLRSTSIGLQNRRPENLVRDEIKAELLNYFSTAHQSILGIAARHAELIFDIATAVRDCLLRLPHESGGELAARTARHARRWESRADKLLNEARQLALRVRGSDALSRLIEESDDAADDLEEAAFLLTLVSTDRRPAPWFEPVQDLAGLLVQEVQEFVKCLKAAEHIHRGSAHEDMKDFLEAVARVSAIEHQSDDANRVVIQTIVREITDTRDLYLFTEIARVLEEASDALNRGVFILRDHILEEVMAT
ncbi:MAG: DUF47 family protein [Rhodospirillales bacterium]|nr:DUF47 family protein [Rhodospirillales bacterium]